jgi:hypothetical protein
MTLFTTVTPPYAEVLESGRCASRWCATSSPQSRRTSWPRRTSIVGPPGTRDHPSCLHVIVEEEWEHHRFAERDLDAIEARSDH